ncbi:dephospho-CoA kinase [Ramlibacter sp. H39-3-26]|jgi:dephospho-CoA kinase|uniref:dephospho-CoA kinase n=1 Tax=Curvibacter soli TaxID=3031331 RepID=UPI0023DA59B2|nr:dephospho-CoA kinase [Ramlibacter sp. H39-3-26]MDF1485468.1 dephospho-CoA kinase [Ramlibacter sp. H39-3-26]
MGLTGGIGSGKSTVGHMFAQAGAVLVDADAIVRSLTAPGGDAIPLIAERFGTAFIDAMGGMDRQRMRSLAFSDTDARHALEAIIHPLVQSATIAAAAAWEDQGKHWIVFDIPLLAESARWPSVFDLIVVVDCLHETQIGRVMTRSRLPRQTVESIIASQATRAQRRFCADAVIFNDGVTLDALRSEALQTAAWFGL